MSVVKVLITGANGFLGRHVVAELLNRGHDVRAMVRPAADISDLDWDGRVDVFPADLRVHGDLQSAFENIDAVIHLAATVKGDAEAQLADNVIGTTRLLQAMPKSQTRRIIFCSSFSVYDFNGARNGLTEKTPPDPRIYERDGYAIAKYWQEQIVRSACAQNGWDLTVLRPGFIWGKGNEYLACLGQTIGRLHLVFGPLTRLPLTHVRNCADCFVHALQSPMSIGQTLNVVDNDDIRAWRYMGHYLKGSRTAGRRIPIPYFLCLLMVHAASRASKIIFRGKGKLPSILIPCRFKARFKPLRYPTDLLRQVLNWEPPLSFRQCIDLTWGEDKHHTNFDARTPVTDPLDSDQSYAGLATADEPQPAQN